MPVIEWVPVRGVRGVRVVRASATFPWPSFAKSRVQRRVCEPIFRKFRHPHRCVSANMGTMALPAWMLRDMAAMGIPDSATLASAGHRPPMLKDLEDGDADVSSSRGGTVPSESQRTTLSRNDESADEVENAASESGFQAAAVGGEAVIEGREVEGAADNESSQVAIGGEHAVIEGGDTDDVESNGDEREAVIEGGSKDEVEGAATTVSGFQAAVGVEAVIAGEIKDEVEGAANGEIPKAAGGEHEAVTQNGPEDEELKSRSRSRSRLRSSARPPLTRS